MRRSEGAATRTDPLASWGERAWKAVLWIFGPSVLSGGALTTLGWLAYNPLYGVLIGIAAFAIIQAGLTFNAIRKSAVQRGPMAQLGYAASPTEAADTNAPSAENDEGTGEANVAPEYPTDEEVFKRFLAQPLKPIRDATFINERVSLDGFLYERCTFKDCTFVYRGEKPFGLADFVIEGDDYSVEAGSPALHAFVRLLVALKYVDPQIEVDKSLRAKDVAKGFRFVKATELDKLSKEELKTRCLEVAEELHQFLEDHALDEADRAEMTDADVELEIMRADAETMGRFRKGPKKEVMGLLAEMKQRGWWKQEDFDLPDWEAVENCEHPHDLRLIANRLEQIGYNR